MNVEMFTKRKKIFFSLILLTIILGCISVNFDEEFIGGIFSELFWLVLGVILTTFVLESVLEWGASHLCSK